MSEWMLLTALGATAAAAMLGLVVALHCRRAFTSAQVRANKRQQALESELGKLRGAAQDLRSRLNEYERYAESMGPPGPPAPGALLNRRTQALRLLRRGDRPEQVAMALSAPRQEVELLQKVQQILLANAASPLPGRTEERVTAPADEPRETSGGPIRFRPPIVH